jgi:hypothetical protein
MASSSSSLAASPQFSSKFKGVSWDEPSQKWQAQIVVGGKKNYLENFDNEEEAARKYDETASSFVRQVNFSSVGGPVDAFSMGSEKAGSTSFSSSSTSSSSSFSSSSFSSSTLRASQAGALAMSEREEVDALEGGGEEDEEEEEEEEAMAAARAAAQGGVAQRGVGGGKKQARREVNFGSFQVESAPDIIEFVRGIMNFHWNSVIVSQLNCRKSKRNMHSRRNKHTGLK